MSPPAACFGAAPPAVAFLANGFVAGAAYYLGACWFYEVEETV